MRLTWWGHSTVLLEVDGARILADPALRPRVGLLRHLGPHPEEPRSGVLDHVDLVLLSHLHHDHCDLPTLRRLDAERVLAPPGAAEWLGDQGVARVEERQVGDQVELPSGVLVTVVEAEHSGRRSPWGPVATAVGHVVDGATRSAWLAGDTGLFPGMRDLPAVSRRGVVDVAVVPVWGWGPNLGPGHLDPHHAAEAVSRVRPLHAVPVHWGSLHPPGMRRRMHHHLTTPGERFERAVRDPRFGHGTPTEVHVLGIGEAVEI